jgi:hypothetical protein
MTPAEELPLDAAEWPLLPHRNGSGEHVARVPRHLVNKPDDRSAFSDLAPYLASEDTAWPAAYAAVPHLVRIAAKASIKMRSYYLLWVGYIEMCGSAEHREVPESLTAAVQKAYRRSLVAALPLLTQTFAELEDNSELQHLLAALAALRGDKQLACVINYLHMGCPHCGEDLLDV